MDNSDCMRHFTTDRLDKLDSCIVAIHSLYSSYQHKGGSFVQFKGAREALLVPPSTEHRVQSAGARLYSNLHRLAVKMSGLEEGNPYFHV